MSRFVSRRSPTVNHESAGIAAVCPDRLAQSSAAISCSPRTVGAYVFYSSVAEKLRVNIDGHWSAPSHGMLVPPFTTHLVSGRARITETFIEVESVAGDVISERWEAMTKVEVEETAQRMELAFARLPSSPQVSAHLDFDTFFFGNHIYPPALDPRIQRVVDRIRDGRGDTFSVTQLAEFVGLSPSRLTHIFRDEVGVTIRQFRAWKRARQVMLIARSHENLLELALEAGYADSTHFSHAIRACFGIQAREFCKRWRASTLIASDDPSPVSHRHGTSAWSLVENRRSGLSAIA